jgi:glucose-1-phosphate adenylyltransferase
MNATLAMILAGGASGELPILTTHRSKAALPFGGRYRVIDFCLSNCANSGIYTVGILAQYNPASLIAHVGNGKPWDLNRRRGGLAILQPYTARTKSSWFRGTADALRQHMEIIRDTPCDNVLVLSGDQVYRMDYRILLAFHESNGAAATIAAKSSSEGIPPSCGALERDADGTVTAFVEKPEKGALSLFSLGTYVFRKDLLLDRLAAAGDDHYDIVYDVLVPLVEESRVKAYVVDDYWADVGWLEQYYEASMTLVNRPQLLDLNDPAWPVFSKPEIRPPTRLGRTCEVGSSLIADGCMIDGTVRRSILFPGVRVARGVTIEDSIVFSDTTVEVGAGLKSCIVDKRVRIGRDAQVGFGNVVSPNSVHPDIVRSGVTVIGTQTQIPAGIRIGRNCLIGSDLAPEAIPNRDIVCGETILSEAKWQKISS